MVKEIDLRQHYKFGLSLLQFMGLLSFIGIAVSLAYYYFS